MSRFQYFKAEYLFLGNASISILLMILADKYILTDEFYRISFPAGQEVYLENILYYNSLLKFWSYPFLIAFNLFKFFIIGLIIHAGSYLNKQPVKFNVIFRSIVLAETVFLVAASVKLIVFYNRLPFANFNDWKNYFPLSITNLMDIEKTNMLWIYPLGLINLFELSYLLLLPYFISRISSLSYESALRNVLISYLPSLLLWALLLTFFSFIAITQ